MRPKASVSRTYLFQTQQGSDRIHRSSNADRLNSPALLLRPSSHKYNQPKAHRNHREHRKAITKNPPRSWKGAEHRRAFTGSRRNPCTDERSTNSPTEAARRRSTHHVLLIRVHTDSVEEKTSPGLARAMPGTCRGPGRGKDVIFLLSLKTEHLNVRAG